MPPGDDPSALSFSLPDPAHCPAARLTAFLIVHTDLDTGTGSRFSVLDLK